MDRILDPIQSWTASLTLLERVGAALGCGVAFYVVVRALTVLAKRRLRASALWKSELFPRAHRRMFAAVHMATILGGIYIISFLLEFTGRIPSFTVVLLALVSLYVLVEAANIFVVDHYWYRRSHRKIPALVRDAGKAVVYIIILIWLLGTVFNVNIGSLLTTSAIFSIIVGLALQDTLGNLFAGLAIQVDNPFNIGDWVLIEGKECKVFEINWRSVKLVDRSNDMIVMPNNIIAKSGMVNYSGPARNHLCRKKIGVSYAHPPNKVVAILVETALQIDEVLRTPEPNVYLLEYGDFAIVYEFRFWIADFERVRIIEDKVFRRIWYQFRRNGIRIPFPIRDVYMQQVPTTEELRSEVERTLRSVDFLSCLPDEDLKRLSGEVFVQHFSQGETLIRQGDEGETFYIVKSGSVEVYVESPQKQRSRIAVLAPGQFFGELSVLTGEKRSASVLAATDSEVFVLHRKSLQEIIGANPMLAETISGVLAARLAEKDQLIERTDKEYLERLSAAPEPSEHISEEESIQQKILTGIRELFGL